MLFQNKKISSFFKNYFRDLFSSLRPSRVRPRRRSNCFAPRQASEVCPRPCTFRWTVRPTHEPENEANWKSRCSPRCFSYHFWYDEIISGILWSATSDTPLFCSRPVSLLQCCRLFLEFLISKTIVQRKSSLKFQLLIKFQFFTGILRTKFGETYKWDVKTSKLTISFKDFNKSNFEGIIFNINNLK